MSITCSILAAQIQLRVYVEIYSIFLILWMRIADGSELVKLDTVDGLSLTPHPPHPPPTHSNFIPMTCFADWARIYKLLRTPIIDSKEIIPLGFVAWWAGGTTNLFLLGSQPP